MAIKKKYEDSIIVGGNAGMNLEIGITSLEGTGFKKVRQEKPLLRVTCDWKPILGTLHGDITLDFIDEGENTSIHITVVAAVDNAYALVLSPGERLKTKFLDEFMKISKAPIGKQDGDIESRLEKVQLLKEQGLISEAEYSKARLAIISG